MCVADKSESALGEMVLLREMEVTNVEEEGREGSDAGEEVGIACVGMSKCYRLTNWSAYLCRAQKNDFYLYPRI